MSNMKPIDNLFFVYGGNTYPSLQHQDFEQLQQFEAEGVDQLSERRACRSFCFSPKLRILTALRAHAPMFITLSSTMSGLLKESCRLP